MIGDILSNYSFGQRMVLYRLLIGLFLAGMIYYAFFFPKEGERALRRSAEAMHHATSWKTEYAREQAQGQGKLHVLEEVECPLNKRFTRNQTQLTQRGTLEWTEVTLIVGPKSYSYSSVTDKWTSGGGYGLPPKTMCAALARGDEVQPFPPLSKWARTAYVSKGDLRDTGIGFCRIWDLTIPRHNL